MAGETLFGSTGFCDLAFSFVTVPYSYVTGSLAQNSVNITYGYGSVCDITVSGQFIGYQAAATQSIVNNLPQWTTIRQDINSRGWNVVNSWGANLEESIALASESISDIFLETANPHSRSRIYYADISRSEITENREFYNFFLNSAFSMPDVVRTKLPAGWSDYESTNVNNVSLDKTVGLLGSNSVKIITNGKIGQIVNLAGTMSDMTASVFILGSGSISFILSIEKIDGTSVSKEVRVQAHQTEWTRIVNTVTVNAGVFRAQITIGSIGGTVHLCAPQLEAGSFVSTWSRSLKDDLPYYPGSRILGQVQVYGADVTQIKVTVHPIAELSRFITANIPTRVESRKMIPEELEAFTTIAWGRRVSFFNEAEATDWVVNDGKIEERSAANQFEVYRKYDIKDLRYHVEGQYGTVDGCLGTIVPKACAIRNDMLYVVCEESYKDITYHTLKIIRPRTPVGTRDYLESLVDFDLQLPFNITLGFGVTAEEVSSIGFSEVDDSWLLVNTTAGRRLFFQLHFDYYYFDRSRKRMYLLENYSREGGSIQVT